MRDQRVGGLFRGERELLRHRDTDPPGLQQPHHLGPIFQVRAGRIAERGPAAAVADPQDAVQVAGIGPAEPERVPDPGTPVFRQRPASVFEVIVTLL